MDLTLKSKDYSINFNDYTDFICTDSFIKKCNPMFKFIFGQSYFEYLANWENEYLDLFEEEMTEQESPFNWCKSFKHHLVYIFNDDAVGNGKQIHFWNDESFCIDTSIELTLNDLLLYHRFSIISMIFMDIQDSKGNIELYLTEAKANLIKQSNFILN